MGPGWGRDGSDPQGRVWSVIVGATGPSSLGRDFETSPRLRASSVRALGMNDTTKRAPSMKAELVDDIEIDEDDENGRRVYPRRVPRPEADAKIVLEGTELACLLLNVSSGGLALAVRRPWAIEPEDECEIALSGIRPRKATIRWAADTGRRVRELGMEFAEGEQLTGDELVALAGRYVPMVLIVEGSRSLRRSCVDLCRARGLATLAAANIVSALDALEDRDVGAIVTAHHHMNGLPGTSLVAAIKFSPQHAKIPMAILSSDPDTVNAARHALPDIDVIERERLTEQLTEFLDAHGLGEDPNASDARAV